jgi:ribosomal protein uL24
MKSDTERKRFYKARLHEKTRRMHVHLSKELRAKLKRKRRAVLVREGDRVKIVRGPDRGKTVKVAKVSHLSLKVYCEGVVLRTAKGREVLRALQPSNLVLVGLEQTKERKELFTDEAFVKKDEKKEAKPETRVEIKSSEQKSEARISATVESKPAASAAPAASAPAAAKR